MGAAAATRPLRQWPKLLLQFNIIALKIPLGGQNHELGCRYFCWRCQIYDWCHLRRCRRRRCQPAVECLVRPAADRRCWSVASLESPHHDDNNSDSRASSSGKKFPSTPWVGRLASRPSNSGTAANSHSPPQLGWRICQTLAAIAA